MFVNDEKKCEKKTIDEDELYQLIREEENFQRLKLERQQLLERIFNPTISASPQFIAKLRVEQRLNKKLIDLTMEEEQIKCTICLGTLKLNDLYEKWPCLPKTPHIFHSDCMLNTLRMKNTCPICRHPVETNQLQSDIMSQFFSTLVL